jgi:tetratricopeptide (TPR) repeat protein
MAKAREAALRAIALDDSVAEAHTALGFVRGHYEYDWPAAEHEFRRAIELNPSYAYGHLFYSNSYLAPFGRHDEAIAEMKTAIELDPLSIPIQSFLGRIYFWARRYDQALAQFKETNRLDPNFAINHQRLAQLHAYMGAFTDATAEETKARMLTGEDPAIVLTKENELRQALAGRGPRGYWETLVRFSQAKQNPPEAYVSPYGLAILYTHIGEKETALQQLEKAYQLRENQMTEIGIEPAFDPLRSDPRFRDLIRQVGLAR